MTMTESTTLLHQDIKQTVASSEEVVKNVFGIIDYVVFGAMLLISSVIGIFFALRSRRKTIETTDEYLMANRKMSCGPVSLSLIASFMSSVTILGVPAEYYAYGAMFTWFGVVYAMLSLIVGWVYMPIFYDLGLSSVYEYLEKRFNKATRLVTTFMYLTVSILYGGIVVYGPALALSEVTGFDMWKAILSTGAVCMFYTTLGGLKAVIWTDVFQCFVMLSGFIAVIIQGSISLGGFSHIWVYADEGGRLDFNHFEFDPRIRHTFWSIMFGGSILWLGVNGVNQAQVQRYVSCRSKTEAQVAIVLNGVGLIVILGLAGMTGLTIFAMYRDCDPIGSGKVNNNDQLFPYVVMDTLVYLPGIPGLFVAGIYSSSLSTISSGMNAMACVTLEDFIKPYTRWRTSTYTTISKLLVIIYGLSYILFAYVASVVGGLIRMAYSIHGIIGGPVVGLFTLGIMLPFVNSWGAFIGLLLGWAVTTWKFVGSVMYPTPAEFLRKMELSTAGCDLSDVMQTTLPYANFSGSYESTNEFFETEEYTSSISLNSTSSASLNFTTSISGIEEERSFLLDFYALSYLYLSAIGCLVTMLTGILISLVTGMTSKSPPSNDLLCEIYRKKRNDGRPALERSSSWFSPSDLGNAQRIIMGGSPADNGAERVEEQQPLQSPDVIACINGDSFIPEKESSF